MLYHGTKRHTYAILINIIALIVGQNRDKIVLTFVYCASILIMVAIEN